MPRNRNPRQHRKQGFGREDEKDKVGNIRISQFIWSGGPGAPIDLPNFSVVPLGLEYWGALGTQEIDEPRLLRAVRHMRGNQVRTLKQPVGAGEGGIPVTVFPGWLRCTRCNLLAEANSGSFRLKKHRDPTRTKFVHESCPGNGGRNADAVPARFMVACEHGHLDDFPWHWYVHRGESECKGPLEFYEVGDSLQTQNLYVECRQCGSKRSMAEAFGEPAKESLPACRGRHPHLPDMPPEECDAELRTVLLGASNVWFSVTRSSLALPERPTSELERFVRREWTAFEDVDSEENLKFLLEMYFRKRYGELNGVSARDLWNAIALVRSRMEEESEPDDLLLPEWRTLTRVDTRLEGGPDFLAKRVEPPRGFERWIDSVVLLERLREVTALLGFTRLEPPGDWDPDNAPSWAPLTSDPPTWLPANEVRGEGIFIRFKESVVRDWLNRPPVRARDGLLAEAQRAWNRTRGKAGTTGYPGIRYVLLHTFSHLLLRELAMESGYSAASIKERIYAREEGEGEPMAGILLYTAAADSDGTLGGLVRLGRPAILGPMMARALERAGICATDPLCLEHDPRMDASLHGAACHACSFVSETSCESGNRYLDRALVVPLWDHGGLAFFESRR